MKYYKPLAGRKLAAPNSVTVAAIKRAVARSHFRTMRTKCRYRSANPRVIAEAAQC